MLSSALPANKMGYYMGVFNFFIVIPQIVAAGLLGFILRTFFSNDAIYALIVGGVAMIIAGLLSLLVNDADEVMVNSWWSNSIASSVNKIKKILSVLKLPLT